MSKISYDVYRRLSQRYVSHRNCPQILWLSQSNCPQIVWLSHRNYLQVVWLSERNPHIVWLLETISVLWVLGRSCPQVAWVSKWNVSASGPYRPSSSRYCKPGWNFLNLESDVRSHWPHPTLELHCCSRVHYVHCCCMSRERSYNWM